MTESAFPFGAVEESPLSAEAEQGSRRNVVVLGALAAVLVAGGAFFLLGGSEDVIDNTGFVPPAPRVAAPVTPVTPRKLPVTTKVALGRNPFKALYVQPAAAVAAPATDTPVTATPVTIAPVAGTPIVVVQPAPAAPAPQSAPAPAPAPVPAAAAPAPAPTASSSPTPAPAPAPAPASTVSLRSVSTESGSAVGTFVYDGKTLTGGQGDVMGGKLLVVTLVRADDSTWTASLRLGDGAPFEVRQGQTVVLG